MAVPVGTLTWQGSIPWTPTVDQKLQTTNAYWEKESWPHPGMSPFFGCPVQSRQSRNEYLHTNNEKDSEDCISTCIAHADTYVHTCVTLMMEKRLGTREWGAPGGV